jgi:hypothetical protein
MQEKPDPVELHGPYAIQSLLGISGKYIERKLGPRDATLRRGPLESALWRVERVRVYQLYRDVMPPASGCPVLYSLVEAAWFVGIGREKFARIAPPARAFAVPANCTERRYPLWAEPSLMFLRKQIATGNIKVSWRSLTRPKAGVSIVPPRHVLAESQTDESTAYSKSHAWVDLVG